MSETERRISNEEILDRITEIAHTLEMFIAEQKAEHGQLDANVNKICGDMYGNSKKGIKEMVNRLWDDAQAWKTNGNAVLLDIPVFLLEKTIQRPTGLV